MKVRQDSTKINIANPGTKKDFRSFGGPLDSLLSGATTGLQYCDKFPMIGVSFVDATTAIVPRTVVGFQTNVYSGFEWFRKESSGLIVNCLLPSWIVLGLASTIQKFIMGPFSKTGAASSWANQESVETLSEYYKKNSGQQASTKHFVQSVLGDIRGLDGENWVDIDLKNPKIKKAVDELTDAIDNQKDKKSIKKSINKAYELIISETRAGEILKFKNKEGTSSLNLSSLLRDIVDLGSKFKDKAVQADFSGFNKSLLNLINTKSLVGLFGIIIPLAASMQYINRTITEKMSGMRGAPIYKDFGKEDHKVELTQKDKQDLFLGKIKSSAMMLGVALLSMMKIPTLKTLQFNGIFPTLDQCRFISTATILGRIWKSQDKNDLRETTELDIGTFAGLYFLGDYAAKGSASLIEKLMPDVKLLNRLKATDKNAPFYKKFTNWVTHVRMKSFDEVANTKTKNLRSICQIANLGFSMLLLGIVLPMYTRKKTANWEKQNEEAKNQSNSSVNFWSSSQNMPSEFKRFLNKGKG